MSGARAWSAPTRRTGSGSGATSRTKFKSAVLDAEKLARVTDAHVRMSLELQAAFGLRREEAIKFTPAYADRGDRVRIKASWAKGGRAREIPIGNEHQRAVLDAVRRLAGGGSLIPGGRSYAAHRKVYEKQTEAAGLSRMHGLRHAFAQARYEALTGWKVPVAGGPRRRSLGPAKRRIDKAARMTIARELGHGRLDVASMYLGS